jgi:hypothetical protein
MAETIAPQAGGHDIAPGIRPAVLPSNQMLCRTLEVPSMAKGNAMELGEDFRGITPHLKAAVVAAGTLAIEGRGTMFDDRIIGHSGLLCE